MKKTMKTKHATCCLKKHCHTRTVPGQLRSQDSPTGYGAEQRFGIKSIAEQELDLGGSGDQIQSVGSCGRLDPLFERTVEEK